MLSTSEDEEVSPSSIPGHPIFSSGQLYAYMRPPHVIACPPLARKENQENLSDRFCGFLIGVFAENLPYRRAGMTD